MVSVFSFLGHTVDNAWIVSFIVNIKPVQRNFELKKSAYDKEVETARAQAELAFQLQTAKVGSRKSCENITAKKQPSFKELRK